MSESGARWDEDVDVIVVGFGAAGACAAVQAAKDGARVLAIDRFGEGGATRRSGGVIYAGCGSPQQRAAGFEDNPEEMRRYLETEVGDAVGSQTLSAFCEQSLANLTWLADLGVRFPEPFFATKTTQPPDGYGLYYSGNELQRADMARPAPRGHVVEGLGMTGQVLYGVLEHAALARGVDLRRPACARRLITDDEGAVVGLEMKTLPDRGVTHARQHLLWNLANGLAPTGLSLARPVLRALRSLEDRRGETVRVRARGGVVLAAGGFVFNQEMMRRHAPRFAECMPLGTPSDDGAGVLLGTAVGAATREMGNCAVSRFICPPEAFVAGVLVNAAGQRFCDESLYGATLSRHIAEQPEGRAYLIIDQGLWDQAQAEIDREERLRDHGVRRILSG